MAHTDIVFAGPPGPDAGRFVEVEDASGKAVRLGEWIQRADGFWVLRIAASAHVIAAAPDLLSALGEILDYSGGAQSALDDEHVVARARAAIAKAEAG